MFIKIARIVFFALLAIFFLGVGFPYLELILGLSAAALAVVEAIS